MRWTGYATAILLFAPPSLAHGQAPTAESVAASVRALTAALQHKDAKLLEPVLDESFRAADFDGPMARSIIGQVVESGRITPSSIRVDSIRPDGANFRLHTTFVLPSGERSFALVVTGASNFVEIPIFAAHRTSEQSVADTRFPPPPSPSEPAKVRPAARPLKPNQVVDSVLRADLDRMLAEDQRYRSRQAPTPESERELLRQQARLDSANVTELLAILDSRGWPGRSLVGAAGSTAAFLILQHAPSEVQERYVEMVRAAVLNGELEASALAFLEDRIRMHRGEKQIYGTQLMQGGRAVYPIEDEANVDQRRAEVGLEPLAVYLRRFGIDHRR